MPPAAQSRYEPLETIGTGTFGTCRKVRRRSDGKLLVWKELDYGRMSEKEKGMLVSEVNILREFRHPNIVRYFDRIIDREQTMIYIVMEYCPGGDLASVIKQRRRLREYLDEPYVWSIFGQVIAAIRACHQRKDGVVMHRDLKPANIFLDENGNAKLGDFGLARVLEESGSFARTYVGTPYYMSPEQMNGQAYNEQSDIWSLGCLIYELAALSPPFNAPNERQLSVKIKAGKCRRLPSKFSDDLQRAVSSMLSRNPRERPSIDTLRLSYRTHVEAEKPPASPPATGEKLDTVVVKQTSPLAAKEPDRPCTSCQGLARRERLLRAREASLAAQEARLAEREARLRLREERLLSLESAKTPSKAFAPPSELSALTARRSPLSARNSPAVMDESPYTRRWTGPASGRY